MLKLNQLRNMLMHPAVFSVTTTTAAVTFMASMITLVGILCFCALPNAIKNADVNTCSLDLPEAFPPSACITAAILLIMALVTGFCAVLGMKTFPSDDDVMPEKDRRKISNEMFTRYLIGIGYFLFLDGLLNFVAFAGFANDGCLDRVFLLPTSSNDHPHSPSDNVVLTVILLLSLGMALLGALFFFVNSLWAKFKAGDDYFDKNKFWGGLWFRLAEAIVITIALFLYMRYKGDAGIKYLPMIALFVGITVKSSEALVLGLASRLLAALTAFIKPDKQG